MLEVRLLGKFEARVDGQPVEIPLRAAQSLLAYLMLDAGTPHRREQLAGLFWPDMPDSRAKSNLRQTLSRLRKAIGEKYLVANDLTIAFDATADYWLDVQVLARKVEAHTATADLIEAVSVYGGELLPGFYDEWALLERERLQVAFEHKMSLLLDRLVEAQRWDDVLDWGERWITLSHAPEAAYRALIMAYGTRGDISNAAAVYQRCEEALRRDLGVEPSPQTRAALERVKREATSPIELPVFRRPRTNLPAALTSFIGRNKEIAEVRQLIITQRAVTLTGSGGAGKTRLAIESASGLVDDFADGVWLIEFAPLNDATLVPHAVASTLGLLETGGRPLVTALIDVLREKHRLLIFDNCEHLIDACAQLAEHLLLHCPDLHILTTSREALGIAGEAALRVPLLSLPSTDTVTREVITHSEAAQLFVERATAALPGFALTDTNCSAVARVCRRLDGIALAIELAASRVKVLRVEQIADRLDDAFRLLTGGRCTALPRQQTLRATIDWSYNLLNDAERIVLRRLSVFAGGATLEAAEVVCSDDELEALEVLDILTQLVNKSLVVAEREQGAEARYHLLETIRQYARDKPLESGEAELVRVRHLDFFLAFAVAAEPKIGGSEQTTWIKRLDADAQTCGQ